MKTKHSLPSAHRSGKKYLWIFLTVITLASFAFGQSGAGTLADTSTTTTTSGDCTSRETNYTWTFTDSLGAVHSFPTGTNTHILESCSSTCNPGRTKSGCTTGCGCPQTGSTSVAEWSTDSQYYLQATAATGTVSTLFDPKFKVVSVIYSPPGNESSQGYGTSTTDGTSTTVGSSFSFSEMLTFSSGIPNVITGSASTGFSTTSSNSSAFTETWMDATSLATDDNSNATYNPTKSNAVNHNLDTFAIWLNPRVSVIPEATSSTTPVSYTVGSQYTPGVSAIVADIILLPAITMEATPAGTSGVTTVPVAYLVPQAIAGENGVNSYMPGLGAVCKNNSLYLEQAASSSPSTPTYCTQTNQCGCVPSDFVNILQTDPLLNYNATTLTASPYAGTVSPLTLDTSGVSVCAENPVPTSANCRYVIVPISKGSTTPLFEPLSGSEGVTYTVSDSNSTTETLGAMASYSLGVSVSSGPIFATLTVADTWTWTDMESIGNSSGTGNTLSVTLETSTAACDENVNIYEDTLYHTFAFQIPTGITTCP